MILSAIFDVEWTKFQELIELSIYKDVSERGCWYRKMTDVPRWRACDLTEGALKTPQKGISPTLGRHSSYNCHSFSACQDALLHAQKLVRGLRSHFIRVRDSDSFKKCQTQSWQCCRGYMVSLLHSNRTIYSYELYYLNGVPNAEVLRSEKFRSWTLIDVRCIPTLNIRHPYGLLATLTENRNFRTKHYHQTRSFFTSIIHDCLPSMLPVIEYIPTRGIFL